MVLLWQPILWDANPISMYMISNYIGLISDYQNMMRGF